MQVIDTALVHVAMVAIILLCTFLVIGKTHEILISYNPQIYTCTYLLYMFSNLAMA